MFCNSNLLVRVSRSFQGIRSFATSIPKLAAEESNDGNLPGSNYSEKSENLLVIINCFWLNKCNYLYLSINIYSYKFSNTLGKNWSWCCETWKCWPSSCDLQLGDTFSIQLFKWYTEFLVLLKLVTIYHFFVGRKVCHSFMQIISTQIFLFYRRC